MKYLITLIMAMFIATGKCVAYDHIIFRTGQENEIKLYQINDEKIIFGYIDDSSSARHEILLKDVYMIYIEKQGNVYITSDGKRITGETKRANTKRYDVIYLTKGGEIAASDIRITEDKIQYSVKTKGTGFTGLIGINDIKEEILDKSEVFMIRYRSGMVDIVTPVENIDKEVESAQGEVKQPQYLVLFHEVLKGENLEKISSKYNVTPKQIITWNELPVHTKPTTLLTVGMQLMIYQPK